jgi:hypothetical protein
MIDYQILIIYPVFSSILSISAVDAVTVKLNPLVYYQDTAVIGSDEVIVEIYENDRLME